MLKSDNNDWQTFCASGSAKGYTNPSGGGYETVTPAPRCINAAPNTTSTDYTTVDCSKGQCNSRVLCVGVAGRGGH